MMHISSSIDGPGVNGEYTVKIMFEQTPGSPVGEYEHCSSGVVTLTNDTWSLAFARARSVTGILYFWDSVGHNVADRAVEVYRAQKTR